jgi:hypothetical protein
MITSSCQIEEALAQRSAARGRNRGLQTVGIGMTRTAMVTEAMNRLQSGVSPGLRPALENMVARLVGVADTAARLEFIRSIDLHDQPGEVVVSPTPPDRVTAGIVRRFTSRSRYTCHACARPGLARDDLGGAVRCPSCAAPALLRAGMRQVLVKLRRVEGLTADPEVLVSEDLVPPLLRPALRRALSRSSPSSIDGEGHSASNLASWCKRLMVLANRPQ